MTDAEPTMMRKIFVVGPTESLLTKRGNRHPALAQYLTEQGYEVEYVTSNFYHAEKRWFSRDEFIDAANIAPYKLTMYPCIGYQRNVSMRRVVSNFCLSILFFLHLFWRLSKKTILILPSRPVEMIFFAALLRTLRGTSVLLDIQDVWPDMLPIKSGIKKYLFTQYCNMFLYPSLPRIDRFMHVAPSFVQWLNRYAPRARSAFVPLGYDANRWGNNYASDRQEMDRKLRIVYVGILSMVFDVLPLLRAVIERNDIHFTMIGDYGEGERYNEVVNFIEDRRMNNVKLIGRINPEDVGSQLHQADIGVVPMLCSSIPNKVYDYIGAGLPILVLGENDSANLVNTLNIGWSCPYSVDGIKQWLQKIDKDEITAKRNTLMRLRSLFDRNSLFQIVHNLLVSDSICELPPDMIPSQKHFKSIIINTAE